MKGARRSSVTQTESCLLLTYHGTQRLTSRVFMLDMLDAVEIDHDEVLHGTFNQSLAPLLPSPSAREPIAFLSKSRASPGLDVSIVHYCRSNSSIKRNQQYLKKKLIVQVFITYISFTEFQIIDNVAHSQMSARR
ncbi:hypothetical protein DFH28DRAFT_1221158 [Melampsora americana]|nr:hypothetical protein DFH28DRAFT_1221158 [Melampsora americana]